MQVSVDVEDDHKNVQLRASSSAISFPGFLAVYKVRTAAQLVSDWLIVVCLFTFDYERNENLATTMDSSALYWQLWFLFFQRRNRIEFLDTQDTAALGKFAEKFQDDDKDESTAHLDQLKVMKVLFIYL